jgi:hypothetical protein
MFVKTGPAGAGSYCNILANAGSGFSALNSISGRRMDWLAGHGSSAALEKLPAAAGGRARSKGRGAALS